MWSTTSTARIYCPCSNARSFPCAAGRNTARTYRTETIRDRRDRIAQAVSNRRAPARLFRWSFDRYRSSRASGSSLIGGFHAGFRKHLVWANYIPLRAPEQGRVLPHPAAAGRWPLIYGRSPPSQPVPAVTSLFPKIKAVGETSSPICPEAATMIPNTQRMFNFDLGETADAIRETVHDFASNEIAPRADQIDKSNQFPRDLWPKIGELGLHGITVEEEYGGAGFGYLEHCIAGEGSFTARAAVGLFFR